MIGAVAATLIGSAGLFGGITNDIGIPGAAGFGIGVVPSVPAGFSVLTGTTVVGHDNYGNYQYADGSIMCWVPLFYYRYGHVDNPTYATYGVNSIDVQPESYFANVAAANAAGYALHRVFVDGGVVKRGIMVDKYMASKQAWGTGYIASSIKNGSPISTASAHNPIGDLTACLGLNVYYSTINAAKARDGVNGNINSNSIFFSGSKFVYGVLALLSLAHGQASSSTTNCAWYNATYNFPKGCNNNALSDTNDTAVKWESDGYSNCGKTGSAGYGGGEGNIFAKSTHNGQNCGVADLNGLMWETSMGLTYIASSLAIGGITSDAVPVFTITSHGLATGAVIQINSITQADWVNFKDKLWTVATTPTADTLTLVSAPDTTGYAIYDAGADPGTITKGAFYVSKESTAMKDFTSGTSSATDHWGATGVAAMMEPFTPTFRTDYPNNGFGQRFGNGANNTLSPDLSGSDWVKTGLGIPSEPLGLSVIGTNLFGQDYFYQYLRDQCFLVSGANWTSGSVAGVWHVGWNSSRAGSSVHVGFRSACYPV